MTYSSTLGSGQRKAKAAADTDLIAKDLKKYARIQKIVKRHSGLAFPTTRIAVAGTVKAVFRSVRRSRHSVSAAREIRTTRNGRQHSHDGFWKHGRGLGHRRCLPATRRPARKAVRRLPVNARAKRRRRHRHRNTSPASTGLPRSTRSCRVAENSNVTIVHAGPGVHDRARQAVDASNPDGKRTGQAAVRSPSI